MGEDGKHAAGRILDGRESIRGKKIKYKPLNEAQRALLDENARQYPHPVAYIRHKSKRMYRKLRRLGYEDDDISQMCFLAGVKAAYRWDPNIGCKSFNGLAVRWFWGAATAHCRDNKTSFPCDGERLPQSLNVAMRNRHGSSSIVDISDYLPGGRDPAPDSGEYWHTDKLLRIWCDKENSKCRVKLKMRTRVILYLRVVEGWGTEEIAQTIGSTNTAVKDLLWRARCVILRHAMAMDAGV